MSQDKLREDILVSVCFSDAENDENAKSCIKAVAAELQARFQFWELLIVNAAGRESEFEDLLLAVPHIRYLSVVSALDHVQRRVVAASEAIGDVVLLASVQEVETLDTIKMIEEAYDNDAVSIGQRSSTFLAEPLVVGLGRISGFEASTRDMQTAAYPRTVLNSLLNDPNPVLALRFPPRDNSIAVIRQLPETRNGNGEHIKQKAARFATRFDLLLRMVTDAGPALLSTVALMSAFMVIGALFYSFYVIFVFFNYDNIAEGWTTLSLAISGMLFFLGSAIFGLCLTLRKLAEVIQGRTITHLINEKSSVDLFGSIANSLNVETDHEAPPAKKSASS